MTLNVLNLEQMTKEKSGLVGKHCFRRILISNHHYSKRFCSHMQKMLTLLDFIVNMKAFCVMQ